MRDDLSALLDAVQNGDEDAKTELEKMYAPLLRTRCQQFSPSFYLQDRSVELEDLLQEARLALFRAAESYDREGKVTFGYYAKRCVDNALCSLLRKYRRKPAPPTPPPSPETLAVAEDTRLMQRILEQLSPYEKTVFNELIQHTPVRVIALHVGKSPKSVSNAIYRIREKTKLV